MANKIVAVSTRHRNSNLRIASTKNEYLENKCSISTDFTSFSSHQLNTLMGLAFTAVLSEGSLVEGCWDDFSIFIDNRNALLDPDKLPVLVTAISYILKCGFSAFKTLGFPYFYDDYMWAYLQLVSPHTVIPMEIKKEMRRILDSIFY